MKYLLPIACCVLLAGCGDSAQSEATAAAPIPPAASAPEPVTPQETPPAPLEAVQPPQTEAAATPPPAKEPSAPPVAKAAAAATAAVSTAASQSAATAAKTVAAASAGVDGAAVFTQKCASCHGMKAEKAALGKSQVIAGWSAQQIRDALKGYQAGTYGKEMKALMQGQAKGLSDAQIDALAGYISSL